MKAKRKRKPVTPRSKVRATVRRLFLQSRERAEALRLASYTCERCGAKRSVAKGREVKIQGHHRAGIGNWERVIDSIFEEILCAPEGIETICKECHRKEHKGAT